MTTRRRRTRSNTVERKIQFYKIIPAVNTQSISHNDLINAVEEVNAIDWRSDDRYSDVGDGNSVCLWLDESTPQIKVKLGKLRTSGLPDVEREGILTPLNISSDEGLSELTHIVIFRDNVVGAEFNFHGPRATRLKHYLHEKTSLVSTPVKFAPLVRRDLEDKLNQFRNVSLVRLRLNRSAASIISNMNQLGVMGALSQELVNTNIPVIDITLRNNVRSRVPLQDTVLGFVKSIFGNHQTREAVDVFKIQGYNSETHQNEVFDLLGEDIVSRKQVIKQRERYSSVDSTSMYRAINESYSELGDVISNASTIEIDE